MADIGKVLREAREARGLSLREISEATKIQARYLKALEENNFSVFPGEVYARGAIKNYAETVGLNPEELLAMHRELSKKEETVETAKEEPFPPEKEAGKLKDGRKGKKAVLAVLAILLLMAAAFYFLKTGRDLPDQGNGNNTQGSQVEGNGQKEDESPGEGQNPDGQGEEIPEEIPEEPAVEVTLVESGSSSEKYLVKNTDKIVLSINFSGRCWIRVKEGELKLISKNYKAGEVCLVENDKEITVRIGNPAGISELKINDIIIPVRKQSVPYNIIVSPVE